MSPPRWPFVFRGLSPLVALAGIGLFSVTRFASHGIERQAIDHVGASLDTTGHAWAVVSVSGQRVRLSGGPPTPSAGERALGVARRATCPTWLGPRVCAISVEGDFDETADGSARPESGDPAAGEVVALAEACEQDLAAITATNRIEFASGSTTIVPSASPILDHVSDVVRGCPGLIRVEGHTDSTGDPDANRTLSAARAEAVRQALASRGVPLQRLVAVGYGQANPIASNATAAGRAQNRRIEFRVVLDAN